MSNQGARARLGANLRSMVPSKAPREVQPEVDIVKIEPPDKLETYYKVGEFFPRASCRS